MKLSKAKNIIFFGLYLLLNPKLIAPLLRGIYLPVYIQFLWIKKYRIDVFIDIGAYRGETSRVFHYIFPNSKIFAFEPVKHFSDTLKSELNSRNITINNVALSNKEGRVEFFYYDNPALSSLLPINPRAKLYKNYKVISKSKIRTTTLDCYFKNTMLKGCVFMKIDTQGTEGLVLQGGKEMLKKVSIIHIETSLEEYYKGQLLFDDIYRLLTDLGFRYTGESRESYFYPSFTLESQVNSVFINERLLKLKS